MTFLFLDKGTFAVLATAHQNSDMFRSTLLLFALICLIGFLSSVGQANAQVSPTGQPATALERQVPVGQLLWDAHEVSVGSLRRYARATGFLSQAERDAGGFIYEAGWTKKTRLDVAVTLWGTRSGQRASRSPDVFRGSGRLPVLQ